MRMHTRRYLIVTAVIFAALIALSNAARERVVQKPLLDGDNVVFTENYRLNSSIDEALFVVAGTITLEDNSRVAGDAALVSNSVRVSGDIDGNLTVTGGEFYLESGGQIDGDVMLMVGLVSLDGEIDGDVTVTGAELVIAPDAEIAGDVIACADNISDQRANSGEILPCDQVEPPAALRSLRAWGDSGNIMEWGSKLTPVGLLLSALFSALLLGGLGGLGVTFFPRQISYIEEAVRRSPRDLLITGFMADLMMIGLVALVVVVLAVVPPLGVILLPVVALVGVLYLGMALAGLITLALVLGEWLMARSENPAAPLATVVVGSSALSFSLHLVALLPGGAVVSLIALTLMATIAVGAAALTRVGTQPLRQTYFVQG